MKKPLSGFSFAPAVGIEPTTNRLTGDCSTTELHRNIVKHVLITKINYQNKSRNRPVDVTDIFLLKNSATPPRPVGLRPCEVKTSLLTTPEYFTPAQQMHRNIKIISKNCKKAIDYFEKEQPLPARSW